MKIAVLFDGGGLARLGLELAGHTCTGVELNPVAHHLSKMVGSGNCLLGDATTIDLSEYAGAWCSPPCQIRSDARTQGEPVSAYSGDYLEWCLSLREKYPNLRYLWVENVLRMRKRDNT